MVQTQKTRPKLDLSFSDGIEPSYNSATAHTFAQNAQQTRQSPNGISFKAGQFRPEDFAKIPGLSETMVNHADGKIRDKATTADLQGNLKNHADHAKVAQGVTDVLKDAGGNSVVAGTAALAAKELTDQNISPSDIGANIPFQVGEDIRGNAYLTAGGTGFVSAQVGSEDSHFNLAGGIKETKKQREAFWALEYNKNF